MKAFRVSGYGKTVAAFAGAFLLLAAFYSTYYIAAESAHECSDSCPVCAVLQLCENFLRQTDSGNIRRFFEVVCTVIILFAVFFLSLDLVTKTPVAHKIRLNN